MNQDNQVLIPGNKLGHASLAATPSATSIRFLSYLFPEPREFAIRLWDNSQLKAQGNPQFTLVLHTPGALRRIFRIPFELAVGEAYIRGDFDIEGDIFGAFCLLKTLADNLKTAGDIVHLTRLMSELPRAPAEQTIARKAVQLSGKKHSIARDQVAVQYHYDVGNDFFALWLGRRMIYSCAYFSTGTEDLDTAQENKLAHICHKLRLQPGDHLLDIGCGWGGLIIYAAQHYDVSALGITLSQAQAQLANERIAAAGLSDRVAVRLMDYRELGDEAFEKIVSIGMFEHVGRQQLPNYFDQTFRLLKPGGLFLNHGINLNLAANKAISVGTHLANRFIIQPGSFANHYVFPDGELVPLSEGNLFAEAAGYEVRDVENLREHYALTLRHWVDRLEDNADQAIQLTNKSVYRIWRLYISGSVYGFENGFVNVNQSLLAKTDHGRVTMPLSRADIYR